MRTLMVTALVFAVGTVSSFAADRRPNILVVFTDDQGWADLGCQGQVDDIRTPHLDRLAAEGVRFTSGYITAPQCCPSRSGLLTGRYQQRYGHDANGLGPMPLAEVTIAERLRDAGYVTGMAGKWHLDPNHSDRGWLEKTLGKRPKPKEQVAIPFEKLRPYLPDGQGFTECFSGHGNRYWATHGADGKRLPDGPKWIDVPGYRLDIQTEAALQFIDRSHDRPFFFYLPYFAPHVPLEATPKYLSRFPDEMPERRRYCLAMMSAIDDGVGRIMARLARHGIDEETLIFFISDNGAPLKIDKKDLPISFKGGAWDGSLNDPYVGEKGMLSEGGIRVPFLARWKGTLPAGRVEDTPVISLDVAATAAAVAGTAADKLDGLNLVPWLTGKAEVPRRALYWRFWGQAAIREGRWKYLTKAPDGEFLFDMESPEHERKNLLHEKRGRAVDLRTKLEHWAARLQRPGIPAGNNPQEARWFAHYFGYEVPK